MTGFDMDPPRRVATAPPAQAICLTRKMYGLRKAGLLQ
jgi:hypothetical protein